MEERGDGDGFEAGSFRYFVHSQSLGLQRMKTRISVFGIGYGAAFVAALTSCALAAEPLGIESAFESTTARISAMPDSQDVPVEWTYTNRWDFPLVVERFEQSCGCLSGQSGQADPQAVPPGKTGTIRASFTPGAYRGLLHKSLHVRFVGHEGTVELIVEAKIPHIVEFSERDLKWDADSRSAAKTIEITSGTGANFTIANLGGVSDEWFLIKQETVESRRHYRISITPHKAAPAGIHSLLVRTDGADPRDRVAAVFLHLP